MDIADFTEREPDLASPQEVLRYLSAVMRGEAPPPCGDWGEEGPPPKALPTAAERMKAAELLGKRYRLFCESAPQQEALPIFVDDIPRAGEGKPAKAQGRPKAPPRRREA